MTHPTSGASEQTAGETDIVARLRAEHQENACGDAWRTGKSIWNDAADMIDRLRAERAEFDRQRDEARRSCDMWARDLKLADADVAALRSLIQQMVDHLGVWTKMSCDCGRCVEARTILEASRAHGFEPKKEG